MIQTSQQNPIVLWENKISRGEIITKDELSKLRRLEVPISKEEETFFNRFFCLSFLDEILVQAKEAEEIMLLSPCKLLYKQQGKIEQINLSIKEKEFNIFIASFSLFYQQEFNHASPFTSFSFFRNNHEFRATLTHASLSDEGYAKLFLRRHSKSVFPLEHYYRSQADVLFFNQLIRDKKNIILSGATGSGKTSFLSSLLTLVDPTEHTIIIEDTKEIKTSKHMNVTRLLTQKVAGKTAQDYLAYSMRLSPDRIMMGEIRSNEIISLILALNTGHRGLLATIHANDVPDTINRMAMLFSLYGPKQFENQHIMKLICHNIDYVVYLKDKKITQIGKILGSDKGRIMYELVEANTL